jgi:hypothetical protein
MARSWPARTPSVCPARAGSPFSRAARQDSLRSRQPLTQGYFPARAAACISSASASTIMTMTGSSNCTFAGSDAARFLKTLQDKAGTSVEIVSQTLLRDADASREAILAKLNETIAKAEPGDSILLFIAGHGVQAADKNYYLATSATRVDNIEHTSLRWSDLSNALAKAHSRIAVFLDTCQSGTAGTDFFATNDASVSALIDRAPSGILIFSASKGRELSEESAEQGGGVSPPL